MAASSIFLAGQIAKKAAETVIANEIQNSKSEEFKYKDKERKSIPYKSSYISVGKTSGTVCDGCGISGHTKDKCGHKSHVTWNNTKRQTVYGEIRTAASPWGAHA